MRNEGPILRISSPKDDAMKQQAKTRKPAGLASLPVPVGTAPMEAKLVDDLPSEPGWQFEPKWDGFRCLAFRAGDEVDLRAKSGKPLARYFPEVVGDAARACARPLRDRRRARDPGRRHAVLRRPADAPAPGREPHPQALGRDPGDPDPVRLPDDAGRRSPVGRAAHRPPRGAGDALPLLRRSRGLAAFALHPQGGGSAADGSPRPAARSTA